MRQVTWPGNQLHEGEAFICNTFSINLGNKKNFHLAFLTKGKIKDSCNYFDCPQLNSNFADSSIHNEKDVCISCRPNKVCFSRIFIFDCITLDFLLPPLQPHIPPRPAALSSLRILECPCFPWLIWKNRPVQNRFVGKLRAHTIFPWGYSWSAPFRRAQCRSPVSHQIKVKLNKT